jgi:hypothetical protein
LEIEHPVFIHEHLLNGRATQLGKVYRTRESQRSSSEPDQEELNDGITGMPDCQKWYLVARLEDTLDKEHKWHQFYAKPVDTVKFDIPEYNDCIEHPMDLGTMYRKLLNDQYESVQAFDDDLHLIVNNATEFNGPHHPVTELGEAIFAYTRRFIGKVPGLDQAQMVGKKPSLSDVIEVVTVEVGLDSYRALELWSRWLYGIPMWDQKDCTDVDEDISSLASIYKLCAGSWWSDCPDHDGEGMNASLDAIKEILVTQTCDLGPLFLLLSRQLESSESMVFKMLVDLLAYGDSVGQGDVVEWPQDLEEKHSEFFGALGLELARRKMGKARPDFMAPCAYHVHPTGSQCDGAA